MVGMPTTTNLSPVALGVAGGTGSGKTTVAHGILEAVGRERIAYLAQDSYYKDIEWQSGKQILRHNFDHPSALDNDLLVSVHRNPWLLYGIVRPPDQERPPERV